MNLVVAQHRIAVRLDPDAGHRVVEDLVALDDALAPVVDEDAAVLPAPDLVALDQRVAARPAGHREHAASIIIIIITTIIFVRTYVVWYFAQLLKRTVCLVITQLLGSTLWDRVVRCVIAL